MWDERYIVQRYRILQEHEGDLRIDSRPDDGTEVVILVPIRTATE
jgi:signal transduction histidine kinase